MEDVRTFYHKAKSSSIKEVKFTELELGEYFSTDKGLCIKIGEQKCYDTNERVIVDVNNPMYKVKAVKLDATWDYIYQ